MLWQEQKFDESLLINQTETLSIQMEIVAWQVVPARFVDRKLILLSNLLDKPGTKPIVILSFKILVITCIVLKTNFIFKNLQNQSI